MADTVEALQKRIAELEPFEAAVGALVADTGDGVLLSELRTDRFALVRRVRSLAVAKHAAQSGAALPLEVLSYALPGDATLARCAQRDGTFLWAIRSPGGLCLNSAGEWESEPSPSQRDEAFLSRCRYGSPQEAYAVGQHALVAIDETTLIQKR